MQNTRYKDNSEAKKRYKKKKSNQLMSKKVFLSKKCVLGLAGLAAQTVRGQATVF